MNIIKDIYSTWDLDGWSIGKELFLKLTDILPIGSTILELGSGNGTGKLIKLYNVISIEENEQYCDVYNSVYIHVPVVPVLGMYELFPNDTIWYDNNILEQQLKEVTYYDCILIDGPKGYRGGFYYNRNLFNLNTLIIFDDVHDIFHYTLMTLISKEINRPFTIYNDDMKKFGIIMPIPGLGESII